MRFEWNPEKNEFLKSERDISFEKVCFHIKRRDVWKITDHSNKELYTNQKLFYVIIEGYIYIVPFVEDEDYIFLKTIIPSRKATREYSTEKEKE
ncbi:MAG: toxin [Spirochaetaceae bacterium]